ncbi:ankyrin repeat domain-containing protein 50-like [Haliotis asinina]|uniref:ankyrin repeat domain-containing protein 50-like n=1 Tax=Haliotis asinina TaxID=109174 RepID=UPI0035318E86
MFKPTNVTVANKLTLFCHITSTDKEQRYPEQSPQQKVDKEEAFVNSPLHDACKKGNLTRVKRILSQGLVDINSKVGNHQKTALMVAAQEGHCEIFDFLIGKGANMSQVDDDGKNFLYWSCKGGHVGMVECVLEHYDVLTSSAMMTPLMQAAFYGYRNVCEFLVCMGASVSEVDPFGYKVLHWGCSGGHLDVVKYLLSLCILDINSRANIGKTPLMKAAHEDHTDIVELLVRKGANVLQVDGTGSNVLHWACSGGHLDVVKYLLSLCVLDINSRAQGGRTPLMEAAFKEHRDIVELLVRKGADVSQVDDWGENVLQNSDMDGIEEIVKGITRENIVNVRDRNKDEVTAAMIAKCN